LKKVFADSLATTSSNTPLGAARSIATGQARVENHGMLYVLFALALVLIVTCRYVQSGASIRSKQIMVAIIAGSLLASLLFTQVGSIALWLQIACAIYMAIYLQVIAEKW
jgi:hypothetical protein